MNSEKMRNLTNAPHTKNVPVAEHMPRKEAVRLIRYFCGRPHETELIPIEESCERVTAEDVLSVLNLPATPFSRWDGISFNFEAYQDVKEDFSCWQQDKDYKFANTGTAILNDYFDTMVKIEDTIFEDGKLKGIIQKEKVTKGQNIIPVGERFAVGDAVVKKDEKITPSQINLMASSGNVNVLVYKKTVVALIPTGNELTSCNDTPQEWQTLESNTYSMRAKCRKYGAVPVVYPIIRDDMKALQTQLLKASEHADFIVISGGSGKGKYDLLQKSIMEIGELYFSGVEHGPGKRTCFSVINNTPVLGLVGPPGGEEMTFDFYALPAIKALQNQNHYETLTDVILDEDIPPHFRVDFYFTMKVYRASDGRLHAYSLPHARLDRSIADHNAYIFVKKNGETFAKGTQAEVELRAGYENV